MGVDEWRHLSVSSRSLGHNLVSGGAFDCNQQFFHSGGILRVINGEEYRKQLIAQGCENVSVIPG